MRNDINSIGSVCEQVVTEIDTPDNLVAKAVSDVQQRISTHVPVDRREDWDDIEISLPSAVINAAPLDCQKFMTDSSTSEKPRVVGEKSNEVTKKYPVPREMERSNPDTATQEYNENSIEFFREELDPRFDWRLAEEWARKYRRDPVFVLRGIMACRECCVSPQWFLSRYLLREKDAPRREDVEEAHRRLLAETRRK